jgi:predicted DNA-binding protein with PD1-like motif
VKIIDVRDGELMETLTAEVRRLGITDAALTLIGGVDSFVISNMPADDASADVITKYDQPGELTGTGEVSEGKVHVHAVCGVEGDIARAGHLHSAEVRTHFVRIYVHE